MTATPVLEMQGIRKQFPGVLALDGVDLTLQAGKVHALLGENGAGKSTLMKILSGAYRRDAGHIRFEGRAVDIRTPRDALALGVRVIYQELNLVPQLTVAENVFLGAAPTRGLAVIDWPRLHANTTRLLADLGLDLPPQTPLRRLSLAQRQMVEIAKALREPAASGAQAEAPARVLVMDEPTSALTAREVDQLFALIARLTDRGVAVVYITHRLDEVERIADEVTVLRDGRCVRTCALAETSVGELVRLMANRDISEHYPRKKAPGLAPTPFLLRVEHLSRAGVLHDISFTLRAGEVLGIAGLLGAGRTELARVLAGADRADAGRIVINGRPSVFRSPRDAIRAGVGLIPEDRKADGLVGHLTVARNIALPYAKTLARFGFLPAGAENALAAPVTRELRIKATPTQPVRLLSGGNQQKVVLGKWLAGDARIFLFDEPTRGVDVGAKVEIYDLMNRLTDQGAGILMISSELPELLGMSDRVLVMCRGRVQAAFDDVSTLTQEQVLSAAFGLPDRSADHAARKA
ncbi:MAG: sugar ABC transporter ATP-binding protein [Acidobacteriota bacterium]